VTVYVDKLPVETSSAADTVGGVLSDLGLTVREGDLVQPDLDAPVSAGMTVWLAKAATVKVTLNGVDQILYTQAETVDDVLAVLGITLAEGDVLSPDGSTPLRSDMSIVIGTTEVRTEEVNETIPAPVRYETDTTMPAGTVKVVPGRDGLRVRKEEVTYRNGVELSRVVLGGGVVEEATPSLHIMGSLQTGGSSPTLNAPDYTGAYSWKLFAKVTWYNASHGGRPASDPNYGMTATGIFVDYGICAVDPSVIPLGTRMYIPGYGQCLAADTGGGVIGNLVDLGFPESAGSNPWGTKNMDVYILD
jgi:3D (Asp-Asp-Asp) domain-containing protein